MIIWGETVIPEGHKAKWMGASLDTVEDSQNPALNFKWLHLTARSTSPLGEKSTSNVKSPSLKSLPPQAPITGNIPTIQWIAQLGDLFTSGFIFKLKPSTDGLL